MKKINILQLITGLGMGGAEKVVLDLSRRLDKNQFNIFVIGLSKRDELLYEYIKNGINVQLLRKNNSLKDFKDIVVYINKFIKENNIEIIHAHMTHSLIIASIIKVFNPYLKIIFTSHSFNVGSKARELILFSLKPFRNTDILFSKHLLKFFYKNNYEIIPNGIDISKYDIIVNKNNIFTFIAIGRLETMKNHKLLIEIANKLKDKYSFQIYIVGEGYLRKELEKLIDKYNLQNIVKLLGLRNDVPKFLNKSHCFVMPSLWEGLPISLLEAGASKLPVIVTPVGSITELINDNNGYLSDLEDFEKNMELVLNTYDEAKLKGQNLFDDIKNNYSLESIIQQHENLYKKLING